MEEEKETGPVEKKCKIAHVVVQDSLEKLPQDGLEKLSQQVIVGIPTKVSCPICYELPFEPHIGTCGHTICKFCKERLLSEHKSSPCPLCKVRTVYNPNFMLRELLQEDAEYKRLAEKYKQQTPEYLWEDFHKRYPDLNFTCRTVLSIKEKVIVLQDMEKQYKSGCDLFTYLNTISDYNYPLVNTYNSSDYDSGIYAFNTRLFPFHIVRFDLNEITYAVYLNIESVIERKRL